MLFDPDEHLPAKISPEVMERIRRIDGLKSTATMTSDDFGES